MTLPPREASPSVRQEIYIAPPSAWVVAVSVYDPFTDEATLVVKKSTLINEFDPCYAPVIEHLSHYCNREVDWETSRDPQIFKRCKRTNYKLYKECPGDEVTHNCLKHRTEMAGGEVVGG